jgi:NAD+ synthase (glutamine-hydrolysing)
LCFIAIIVYNYLNFSGTAMRDAKVTLVQCNPIVGAIAHNADLIIAGIKDACSQHESQVIVFPELVICGYPLDDLLFHETLYRQIDVALARIAAASPQHTTVILGLPRWDNGQYFNSAVVIQRRAICGYYDKQILPNYGVFNEKRHFTPGTSPLVFEHQGQHFALMICEDLWHSGPIKQLQGLDLSMVLSLNASPFQEHKQRERIETLCQRSRDSNLPIAYVNLHGGQDELVFDGSSMFIDPQHKLVAQAASFRDAMLSISLKQSFSSISPEYSLKSVNALIYQALCCGLRDYVNKNNFTGVLIGLSGGIDSALTLTIACDALGSKRVRSVMLPSQYTADMSIADAQQQADMLNVQHNVIPITATCAAIEQTLKPSGAASELMSENIQARARGLLLMALANASGEMLLATSNKSELAVGYATLYGDMCGGFCALKDVLKSQVYELANYRNSLSLVIPERVIERPPSAELKANQCDQDTLPDYATLDALLHAHLVEKKDQQALIAQGFESAMVQDILKKIQRNEFKRHQAPPGVKISQKAFGRDRRFPLTNCYVD